jgi:hypothetical protein
MAKEKAKEPLSPSKRKELRKQKENQETKQNLTQDYAYTGIPGAKATAKGVKYKIKMIFLQDFKNNETYYR